MCYVDGTPSVRSQSFDPSKHLQTQPFVMLFAIYQTLGFKAFGNNFIYIQFLKHKVSDISGFGNEWD